MSHGRVAIQATLFQTSPIADKEWGGHEKLGPSAGALAWWDGV